MGKIERFWNINEFNLKVKNNRIRRNYESNSDQFRWGLSKEVHTEDALALGADEGRSKLR